MTNNVDLELLKLSSSGDLKDFTTYVDSLTASQIASVSNTVADDTLLNLSVDTAAPSSTLAHTLGDFMQKVGNEADGTSISQALANLAHEGQLSSISAIVDNLAMGKTLDPQGLDQTLVSLSLNNNLQSSTLATTLGDFMQKVGNEADGTGISQALANLAQEGQLSSVSAIVDNLAMGKTLDAQGLDQTLVSLSLNNNLQSSTLAHTLGDFMQKVGNEADGTGISQALANLAQEGQLSSVSAIVDNLAMGKTLDAQGLDQTLVSLSLNNNLQSSTLATTLGDFMQKVGNEADGTGISQALANLAQEGQLSSISAIVDNLAIGKILDPQGLDQTLNSLSLDTTAPSSTLASTVKDFMVKVGSETDASVIAQAIHNFIGNNNTTEIESVTNNVSIGQKSSVIADLSHADTSYLAAHHIVIV